MASSVKSAARSAQEHPAFQVLARGGYVATGLVHFLVGALAIVLALSSDASGFKLNALETLYSAPFGIVVLWIMAGVLWALALYNVAETLTLDVIERRKRWGRRISDWARAFLYAVIGIACASIALGRHANADLNAQNATSGILGLPGGSIALALLGLGIAIGGVVFAVMGCLRSFRKTMQIPATHLGTWVACLGVVGYLAEAVVIMAIGALVATAAVLNDPAAAGALDSALHLLKNFPGGVLIVLAVGLGLMAYGVFCGFRARYARL